MGGGAAPNGRARGAAQQPRRVCQSPNPQSAPPKPPTAPRAQDEWVARGAGGQVFDPVDLRDDWADFDEKAGESVSVMGVEARFELHKGK